MMTIRHLTYSLLLTMLLMALLAACASIGTPEGGPRDYTPPTVVKSSPQPGAVNFKGNKIEISFDEIINLSDQQKKVIVSPPGHTQPSIKALGKKVVIEFREDLEPNTTYVIDFANAIEDNNESNQLENYSFVFSTGEQLDSLAISGIVLRASDLEPMQYVLVGVHSNLDDTAFTHLPLERVCRTNDRGQFTLRGLRPGSYHVFALNDVDGDYRMARSEDIAFLDQVIVPSTSQYSSQDTIFTFDRRVDTIMDGTHTLYLPNNLLLCMFNENYRSQYLKRTNRPSANKLLVQMGASSDTLPHLQILQPEHHAQDWYRLERTAANDSLVYWLTDSSLIKTDTLVVQMTYLHTDSTDNLSLTTDTIHFGYRKPNSQIKEEQKKQKELEQRAKRRAELEQKSKQATEQGKTLDEGELDELKELMHDDIAEAPKLKLDFAKSGTIDIGDSIILQFDQPIASFDPQGVHVAIRHDTLWMPMATIAQFRQISDVDIMRYWLPLNLEPDSSYRITIDSAAIISVYGLRCDSIIKEFKIRPLEDYANLYVQVNVQEGAFAQLVTSGDKVMRTATVHDGAFQLLNVPPATYCLRLILDTNGNGLWDTGNYAQHLQPEEVYYYPKSITLRRNWDIDLNWNIYETALDLQKPDEIKRNKPEKAKNKVEQKEKKDTNAEEEDDEFSTGLTNSYTGNSYTDSKNKLKTR